MPSPASHLRNFLDLHGGSIPFESFMEQALYHPGHGYYTRHIKNVGRAGDFSTSATLSPVLGRSIARWLLQMRKTRLPGGSWHIIEIGGGNGELTKAILKNIPWWRCLRLHYSIVEISPKLQSLQRETLKGYRVDWFNSIAPALEKAQGKALIFSNELVDAFPCAVLRLHQGRWQHLHITRQDETNMESWNCEIPESITACPLSALSQTETFPEGQIIEVHPLYREWLQSWRSAWKQGAMLTIDYGDPIETLYDRRPHGSLRAYFQHFRLDPPDTYQRFGMQDLTANVNFTDLMRWGEQAGLRNVSFTTQREFVSTTCPDLIERFRQQPNLQFLIDPHGMGSEFKALHQEPLTSP